MDLHLLSTLAEIIGCIAVVISLIYLARQIRQSNIFSHAHTRRDMLQATVQELYKVVDNPGLWVAFNRESLSQGEKYQLHAWIVANIRQREFEWFQMRHGIIDVSTFKSYTGIIGIILGTKRTRRWWEEYKIYYDPEFIAYVDDYLEKQPLSEFHRKIEEILE